MVARRRLLAVLAALAAFGIAFAVGISSGGSAEPTSQEGPKKISVASGAGEAPPFEAAGALPALREKPQEPTGPTTPPTEPPVGPVEPPVVDPPPPPSNPPDDQGPVVVD